MSHATASARRVSTPAYHFRAVIVMNGNRANAAAVNRHVANTIMRRRTSGRLRHQKPATSAPVKKIMSLKGMLLFKAGQHKGVAAAKHLDRIPAPDLRLFPQIELCAALAGLPQL